MIKIFVVVAASMLVGGLVVSIQNMKKQETESILPIATSDNGSEELVVVERSNAGEKSVVESNNTLDLSGQGLIKTPSYVFEKKDIQELNLSNNQLSGSLQAEVRHLQNLKVLTLSNNDFTGLPAEVGQLEMLEVLDLSNNKLTGIPYELGNLKNLKVLNLRGNQYAEADLVIIKQNLPTTVEILID